MNNPHESTGLVQVLHVVEAREKDKGKRNERETEQYVDI